MLSRLSRRGVTIMRHRNAIAVVSRRLVATQTFAQVQALERIFENLHWHDAKDKVEEIRELMDEHKTNHSVKTPDAEYEQMVTERLHTIQGLAEQVGANHGDVFHRVFNVERDVKQSLYA